MHITSATFVKGIVGTNDLFEDGTPQIVFIGRSNVGKSSVINAVANQKNLARTSSFPGRTQEINVFLINKRFYLIDLPGYGYAKVPNAIRRKILKMIDWFLFSSEYHCKKVILIIDANIGPTGDDMDMFEHLVAAGKDIVIIANKVDKIKPSVYDAQLQKIAAAFPGRTVIPFSAKKNIGVSALANEMTA